MASGTSGFTFQQRLTDIEALLWALDQQADPVRSTIVVVVEFDRRPDAQAVRARMERLSQRLPRLKDRVALGAFRAAAPFWEADPDFDAQRHLVTFEIPRALDLPSLLRLAEAEAAGPFAADRPPWDIQLVLGEGDTGGLIIKLHHTYTDGLGAVKLASELFDFERHPADSPAPGPGIAGDPPKDRRAQAAADIGFEARQARQIASKTLSWMGRAIKDAVVDPEPRAQALFELARSGQEMLTSITRGGSQILTASRSAGVRAGAVELPLEYMKAAAARTGGTVNDVFLAGAVGGLRIYLEKRGQVPQSLRIGVPVSTRGGDTEMEIRNQVIPLVIGVPLAACDPADRVGMIHELVAAARNQPAKDLFEPLTALARRVPGVTSLSRSAFGKLDVVASNVPGSPVDLYLGGAKIDRMVPIGPRGVAGLNLTLLSHGDTAHIGVNMDPATVPDPRVLVDCLESGFDEVL